VNGSATGVAKSRVDAARRDAEAAARAAGVEIRSATRGGVQAVQEIVATVWGPGQRLQANLLMAMAHAGGTVAAALRGDEPVGACVGFLGWNGGVHLHSHMAAVRAGARTTGVGYALKLWQRAVCLEHGIAEIRWTYDPLVRRNAYFNLVKLGARVVDYHPDFYGEMDDIVNAGDRSDRFEVSWLLDSDDVAAALLGTPALAAGPTGLVTLPEDYDSLRRENPATAQRWRERVRAQLANHWDAGLRPVWAASGEGYVFRPAGTNGGQGARG
jgi:predicted GNAT superfamily acetyltransferase